MDDGIVGAAVERRRGAPAGRTSSQRAQCRCYRQCAASARHDGCRRLRACGIAVPGLTRRLSQFIARRQTGAPASSGESKKNGPVAGLGRYRQIVVPPQPQHERERLSCDGRSGMVIICAMSGLPCRMPSVPLNTSASMLALGRPRRRLRMSGVVSSTSPIRRKLTTRIRGRAEVRLRGRANRHADLTALNRRDGEPLAQRCHELFARGSFVGARWLSPQTGLGQAEFLWRRAITCTSNAALIAERCDIELVAFGNRLERARPLATSLDN